MLWDYLRVVQRVALRAFLKVVSMASWSVVSMAAEKDAMKDATKVGHLVACLAEPRVERRAYS